MKQIIRDIVVPRVEEAITHIPIVDDYSYELVTDLIMTDNGPQPILFLFLSVPNPAQLGTIMAAAHIFQDICPDEASITVAVNTLASGLADNRKSSLVLP